MANIKFSQFTQKTTLGTVDFLVGYTGAQNIQIDPADLLSGYSQGTGAAGQVTFFSSTSTVTGDPDFYWNNTNKRLGVGISSPNRLLHVNSNGQTDIHLTTNSQGTSASDGMTVFLDASGSGGLWLRENADMRFATSGTERVWIKGGGNVGIGTNNPAAKLQVSGTFISTGVSQLGSGGSNVYLTSSSAGSVGIGTSSPATKLEVDGLISGKGGAGWGYTFAGDLDTSIENPSANTIGFKTTGAERMRITSSGNVGIGTDSPSDLLQLKAASNNDAKISMLKSDGAEKALIGYDDGNGGLINLYNEAGTRNVVVRGYGNSYFNGGNFGIGTSSPSAKLQIESTSGNALSFTHSGQETYNISHGTSGLYLKLGSTLLTGWTQNHDFTIWDTSGNNYVMFDGSTQKVGIGTGSPVNNLHVNSSSSSATAIGISNTSTGASRLYLDASNGDFSGSDYMWLGQNNDLSGEIFMPQNAGSFHIKTQPGGTATIQFTIAQNGTATFAGNINFGDSHFIGDDGNDNLLLQSSSGEAVIINGNTNVRLQDGGNTKLTTTSTGVTITGDLEIENSSDGIILESPDGTRYRVTVANGGTLSVSAV